MTTVNKRRNHLPNAETRAAIEEGRKLMASGATRKIDARKLFNELDKKAAKPKKSRAGRLTPRGS